MLETDIQEVIRAQLPAQVGDVLRKRLADANRLENELKVANEANKGYLEKIVALEAQISRNGNLDHKAMLLAAKEAEVNAKLLKAEIMDIREKHAQQRVDDMRSIVSAVFANNMFKYRVNDSGMIPVATQGGSYPTSMGFNRTVEATGEGAPPPAPGIPPGTP